MQQEIINLVSMTIYRRVRRMLHLPLPNQNQQRLSRRSSRNLPHLPSSLFLIPEKKRMKGTRSWQSFRWDAHKHKLSYTSYQIYANLVNGFKGDLRKSVAFHLFLWWLISLEVAEADSCQKRILLGSPLELNNWWQWSKESSSNPLSLCPSGLSPLFRFSRSAQLRM